MQTYSSTYLRASIKRASSRYPTTSAPKHLCVYHGKRDKHTKACSFDTSPTGGPVSLLTVRRRQKTQKYPVGSVKKIAQEEQKTSQKWSHETAAGLQAPPSTKDTSKNGNTLAPAHTRRNHITPGLQILQQHKHAPIKRLRARHHLFPRSQGPNAPAWPAARTLPFD